MHAEYQRHQSFGLSVALHLASDMFFKIDDSFITDWKKYLAENQE
jgi:hypothetical protein